MTDSCHTQGSEATLFGVFMVGSWLEIWPKVKDFSANNRSCEDGYSSIDVGGSPTKVPACQKDSHRLKWSWGRKREASASLNYNGNRKQFNLGILSSLLTQSSGKICGPKSTQALINTKGDLLQRHTIMHLISRTSLSRGKQNIPDGSSSMLRFLICVWGVTSVIGSSPSHSCSHADHWHKDVTMWKSEW